MRYIPLALLLLACPLAAQSPWRELFNGRDLTGWRANVYPDSWSVVDGTIKAHATKESSHLFLTGPGPDGLSLFRDFELEAEVKGEPNANSGIFIHADLTTHSPALRLSKGYEIQLNSTTKEKRKTGSLYAVVDLDTSPVDETQWFRVHITARGPRITIALNGQTVVDYLEPANVQRPGDRAGRKLSPTGGAIALQAHDPGSVFYFRRLRLRELAP